MFEELFFSPSLSAGAGTEPVLKNIYIVVGLFLHYSFWKLRKSKMYLKLMQGSGLWRLSPDWFILLFAFFSRLVWSYLMSGHRWSGTRCLPASMCLGFEISSGCHLFNFYISSHHFDAYLVTMDVIFSSLMSHCPKANVQTHPASPNPPFAFIWIVPAKFEEV